MKHRMQVAVLLALSSGCAPAFAESPTAFTELFATTCMANFYTPDKLREAMSASQALELPADEARFFLIDRPGTAWGVRRGEDKYIVALVDGFCAVYAKRAPVEETQEAFEALVSSAPEPLVATRTDDKEAGPNDDDLASTAYRWSRPEDAESLVFTLTTSKSAKPVQAMASVGIARKSATK